MKELYLVVRELLLSLPDPINEEEKMFKTVQVDKGQFERIIHDVDNTDFPHPFPAVFIHFVNVSYLVSQNRIGEGRGTMRVRFILNRLNDQDADYETEIFDYAGYVNAAIQDGKNFSPVLADKCTLQYFDMPTSSNQCQPCWLDYSVKFTDESGDKYRDWVDRVITTPTFTNRSDVPGEDRPDLVGEEYENQPEIVTEIPDPLEIVDE